MTHPRSRSGFTLVELMMVVAIIGILASIATANFMHLQYQAKRAEILPNVDGIKATLIAHLATFDSFTEQTTYHPTPSPGKKLLEWTDGSGFDELGWRPDGKIRGAYKMHAEGLNFRVYGISDVDGDGQQALFTATRDLNAFQVTHDLIY
jgi:prepilin-type N-terminal cleavage/methylation domain-containing protein